MGWWHSGPSTVEETHRSFESQDNAASTDRSTTAATAPTLSRDEQAELELQSFLSSLNETTEPKTTPQPSTKLSSKSSTDSHPAPGGFTPSALYPETMSCTQAFDQAVYCYSLGGQFLNVYRYGGLKDCSEQWGAWRFCMRSRSHPDEERRAMIRSHYRERAAKYKSGPSSEDVWEPRREPVHGAFQNPG